MKDGEILNFIGLSGHLMSGATGHYETFHEGLFLALLENEKIENCTYIGSKMSPSSWFLPLIPPSLVSKYPWASTRFSAQLLTESRSNGGTKTMLHVYEGNLYWLFHVSWLVRKNPKIVGYVNFFNSAKYSSICSNPIRSRFIRTLISVAIRGVENKIVMSADTAPMSRLLIRETCRDFQVYPMYSILNPHEFEQLDREKVLFLIRGTSMMEFLINNLQNSKPEFLKKITVHGVPTNEQIQICENLGIEVSKTHLKGQDYIDFYKNFSHVVILYDPQIFSNQSSGRLCDALVAGCHLLVMKDSALSEYARVFQGYSEFELTKPQELIQYLVKKQPHQFIKHSMELPTSKRAVIKILEQVERNSRADISKIRRFEFSAIFLILQQVMFLMRITHGTRSRVYRIFGRTL